jgi:phosphoglycolate phosphatase-like HAD superfamily hydrolase
MSERLILFDVDGTLLTTNGQATAAMRTAYRRIYGVTVNFDGTPTDGKTELCLAYQLLSAVGLSREQVRRGLPAYWHDYELELRRTLRPEEITVFPGVRELLRRLAGRRDALLGLLTGNIEPVARLKLEAAGLTGFTCGAFGQHHERREALPAVALEAAERLSGTRFSGRAVNIVGDTPNDIACGRHLGVTAVAVATGKFDLAALAAHHPHHLFSDLSDTDAVLTAVGCG